MGSSAKVYVGNLPLDVKERELEDMFFKFGKIRYIDIKAQSRPPAFAFVEFVDARDAEEAVRRRDGIEFAHQRLRVEIARGGTGLASVNYRPPRSTGFRVLVKGLPKGCSWQDLKDHIRTAVRPNYTDVRSDHDGHLVGVVEFDTHEDMKLAIRKLDDSEFNNPRYDRGHYIRIIEDTPDAPRARDIEEHRRSRSRSRSRSRRRPASRSASPMDRDEGRRREEPARGRSVSRSRSRSRSRDSRD